MTRPVLLQQTPSSFKTGADKRASSVLMALLESQGYKSVPTRYDYERARYLDPNATDEYSHHVIFYLTGTVFVQGRTKDDGIKLIKNNCYVKQLNPDRHKPN